ncbi:MAG: phosphoribosylanthranilate isomerase [Candidatus Omnitrophica bacterium]|nr:phosphoribosylanthranilate isomerase [Candidatus Omnitrophota bacterium]
MTKVKVCGNTNAEDVTLAISLGVDYLGFIFAESKRRIEPTMAARIITAVPDFKNFVGVFVNHPKKDVEQISQDLGIKILQFHGDETALYCQYFMDHGFQVIKTFRIKDAMSLKRMDEYNVAAFLFDAFQKDSSGGTGIPFDWNLIEKNPYVQEKLFLAGGLNPDNLEDAIQKIHPYAVDVASGVEKSPGKKDPVLLERFISIAKNSLGLSSGPPSRDP